MNTECNEPSNIVAINGVVAEQLEIEKKRRAGIIPVSAFTKTCSWMSRKERSHVRRVGFAVDAFDYIKQWASEGDSRMTSLKNIEVRRKIAQSEHNDLMRKIKNLRQRLKRAGVPQPPEERYEYDSQRWNIR